MRIVLLAAALSLLLAPVAAFAGGDLHGAPRCYACEHRSGQVRVQAREPLPRDRTRWWPVRWIRDRSHQAPQTRGLRRSLEYAVADEGSGEGERQVGVARPATARAGEGSGLSSIASETTTLATSTGRACPPIAELDAPVMDAVTALLNEGLEIADQEMERRRG